MEEAKGVSPPQIRATEGSLLRKNSERLVPHSSVRHDLLGVCCSFRRGLFCTLLGHDNSTVRWCPLPKRLYLWQREDRKRVQERLQAGSGNTEGAGCKDPNVSDHHVTFGFSATFGATQEIRWTRWGTRSLERLGVRQTNEKILHSTVGQKPIQFNEKRTTGNTFKGLLRSQLRHGQNWRGQEWPTPPQHCLQSSRRSDDSTTRVS